MPYASELEYSKESDLPDDTVAFKIFEVGFDGSDDDLVIGGDGDYYIIVRRMTNDSNSDSYIDYVEQQDKFYKFPLKEDTDFSAAMWDYGIVGYDGLSHYHGTGGLYSWYLQTLDSGISEFPNPGCYYEFTDGNLSNVTQFYTRSTIDITTGRPW